MKQRVPWLILILTLSGCTFPWLETADPVRVVAHTSPEVMRLASPPPLVVAGTVLDVAVQIEDQYETPERDATETTPFEWLSDVVNFPFSVLRMEVVAVGATVWSIWDALVGNPVPQDLHIGRLNEAWGPRFAGAPPPPPPVQPAQTPQWDYSHCRARRDWQCVPKRIRPQSVAQTATPASHTANPAR